MIKYFSYENFPIEVRGEWKSEVDETIDQGIYISGEKVSQFEKSFAAYLGTAFAIGVGNGYDGLFAAIVSLHLPPKSRIAVPVHTFIACWNAITWAGHIPVGVEVNHFGNINTSNLESLTERVDALLVVHMHGVPVEMKSVMTWANQNQVKVIEDCSQAHGAEIDGIKVGAFGDIGVFSFYPTKNLPAAGDAGIVVTNNPKLASDIRSFCNYGSNPSNKYLHETFGVNSRLDPIQAAILLVNLKYLDEWNNKRRQIATTYMNLIKNPKIGVVHQSPRDSVYHHFIVRTIDRDDLRSHLAAAGIGTEIHYPKLASDEWAKFSGEAVQEFTSARQFSSNTLSLPLYPWLPETDVMNVADSINKY